MKIISLFLMAVFVSSGSEATPRSCADIIRAATERGIEHSEAAVLYQVSHIGEMNKSPYGEDLPPIDLGIPENSREESLRVAYLNAAYPFSGSTPPSIRNLASAAIPIKRMRILLNRDFDKYLAKDLSHLLGMTAPKRQTLRLLSELFFRIRSSLFDMREKPHKWDKETFFVALRGLLKTEGLGKNWGPNKLATMLFDRARLPVEVYTLALNIDFLRENPFKISADSPTKVPTLIPINHGPIPARYLVGLEYKCLTDAGDTECQDLDEFSRDE